jgi:hypothetical protein
MRVPFTNAGLLSDISPKVGVILGFAAVVALVDALAVDAVLDDPLEPQPAHISTRIDAAQQSAA